MKYGDNTNYGRIEAAIGYIKENFREQPDLDAIAEKVHLSPFHFQRIFTEWAGVSPKKFLQFISLNYAKKLLEGQASLFDATYESGLSGTGRLHDLFIKIEGMTPGEYKNGGAGLTINHSFADSPFGSIIVGSTAKGICHLAFADDESTGIEVLKNAFPNATFRQVADMLQQNALHIFKHDWRKIEEVKLNLKGTEFQLKVWEALLKIPVGKLSTYGNLAKLLQRPNASRAVGTAIGDNPVAFLIPCHRVIQSTGQFGQYHWGSNRKTAIIGWEAAFTETNQ
ncbi:cysteine methyltransferase [Flavipsychrobacter stenotrophus]|uniref:methylated-DNA--[protein]-cysteine S-methyltransferase n=1 Tax=Flavipsychrobacter stenotrophus TaxID=2077091 RepID=A0A2S7STX3_9BACT|nr:methylated-DNA--[protein]-cysteine S-methyltransferase [Flavipsychrobacter stenotrophus]PQJ10077.1 cysteine methyltransferase [Flavipsychrobacter stenotrophus]